MTQSSAPSARERCDVLIIGAGPVGLSLALSLRGTGLDVRLVERQSEDALADPAYDGREIALSLRSVEILKGTRRLAPYRAGKDRPAACRQGY